MKRGFRMMLAAGLLLISVCAAACSQGQQGAGQETTQAAVQETAEETEQETTEAQEQETYDETYEENGFTLHYTPMFQETKGRFYPYPTGVDYDTGVGAVPFWYVAMSQEDADALYGKSEEEWTDEDEQNFLARQGELLEVVTINGGRGIADLMEMETEAELSEDWFTEVGKAGDE